MVSGHKLVPIIAEVNYIPTEDGVQIQTYRTRFDTDISHVDYHGNYL